MQRFLSLGPIVVNLFSKEHIKSNTEQRNNNPNYSHIDVVDLYSRKHKDINQDTKRPDCSSHLVFNKSLIHLEKENAYSNKNQSLTDKRVVLYENLVDSFRLHLHSLHDLGSHEHTGNTNVCSNSIVIPIDPHNFNLFFLRINATNFDQLSIEESSREKHKHGRPEVTYHY